MEEPISTVFSSWRARDSMSDAINRLLVAHVRLLSFIRDCYVFTITFHAIAFVY